MPTNNPRDSFSKQEIRKILIAGLIFIMAGVGYYFYLRHAILRGVERRANETLQQTERLIRARMGKAETVVNAMEMLAENLLDKPDFMYDIAEYIVKSTPQITGADIAFIEYYYPDKGKWYQPYVGYINTSDELIHRQLGGEDHDYFTMEWYQKGLTSDDGVWSNPYFDPDGGHTSMMTYARAVIDSAGRRVGVISADIPLDTLAKTISKIRIYPHSYCTLVSESGQTIVEKPAEANNYWKCHTFTQKIEGKNMILTLTIADRDMYSRLRKATLAFFALALSGLFAVFFTAYRSIKNLWRLGDERLKNQHIEDELALARKIQMSLVPDNKSDDKHNSVDICGFLQPAKFVGGDLYDYYVRDNKLFFCIGDISGKGVPGAMLMSIAHSLFRTLSAHSDRPERIMQSLNRSISNNNPDIMFITMFIGVMDLESGMITYCNAGHNPPILIQSGKANYMDNAENLLLGVDINAEYVSRTVQLYTNDTLFLYTDGLTEAENSEKLLLGEKNALDVADKFDKMPADKQIDAMCQAVQRFVGTAEQSDDLTMLAIHYTPAMATLTMNNDINELDRLEPFLNAFFEQNKINLSLLSKFDLALEEALANVIMYAYPEGEQGEVEISIEMKDGHIHTCIRDAGVPFNPLQQPEAELSDSVEERPIGGLGIYLIKEIMDKVEYQRKDGNNVLTMTMNI